MSEKIISDERLEYTIDLLITMVVEEISKDMGMDYKDVLIDFLLSKTGKALYDDSTKLWCNGPSYIADVYKEELEVSIENLAELERCINSVRSGESTLKEHELINID